MYLGMVYTGYIFMENRKLTKRDYWESIYQKNFHILNILSNFRWLQSYYHFIFQKILTRYIDPMRHKNVLEIGCAPGNYLVKLHQFFSLTPFGVEYAEKGYAETLENFKKNDLPQGNIFLSDFFDENFQRKNYERYDMVFSAGFIEHFGYPHTVLVKQMHLLKKGGLLVCLIPNVRYLNEWLSPVEIIDIHNQEIMDITVFRSLFDGIPGANILYCNYFGGIFNVGVLNMRHAFLKRIVFLSLILQRITFDFLQKFIFIVFRRDIVLRYTSPSLICILQKQ
jgi:SAM-dependent methyltransferase